jgi:hypothetical protein
VLRLSRTARKSLSKAKRLIKKRTALRQLTRLKTSGIVKENAGWLKGFIKNHEDAISSLKLGRDPSDLKLDVESARVCVLLSGPPDYDTLVSFSTPWHSRKQAREDMEVDSDSDSDDEEEEEDSDALMADKQIKYEPPPPTARAQKRASGSGALATILLCERSGREQRASAPAAVFSCASRAGGSIGRAPRKQRASAPAASFSCASRAGGSIGRAPREQQASAPTTSFPCARFASSTQFNSSQV